MNPLGVGSAATIVLPDTGVGCQIFSQHSGALYLDAIDLYINGTTTGILKINFDIGRA